MCWPTHATPFQNSLLELYALVSIIDPYFGHRIAREILFHIQYNLPLAEGVVVTFMLPDAGAPTVLEQYKGRSGVLALYELTLDGPEKREHLVFAALDDAAVPLSDEACVRLWELEGKASPTRQDIELLAEQSRRGDISEEEYGEMHERWRRIVSDEDREQLGALYTQKHAGLLEQAEQRSQTLLDAEREKLNRWAKDVKLDLEQLHHRLQPRRGGLL